MPRNPDHAFDPVSDRIKRPFTGGRMMT